MNERLKLTAECRPNEEEVVLCCTNKGNIYCGVVNYPHKLDIDQDCITISMFVNEKETEVMVEYNNIRWWQLFPITKKELWNGSADI